MRSNVKDRLLSEVAGLKKKNAKLLEAEQNFKNKIKILREAEAELKTYLSAVADMIIVFDSKGTYVRIPRQIPPGLLYKPRKSLLGKTLHEVFDKPKADFFLTKIRQSMKRGSEVAFEYSLKIGKEEKWFSAVVSPLPPRRVLYVARDITERKQAEQALKKSEQRFRTLWNKSADGMRLTDRSGTVLMVNDSFCKIVGMSPNEIEGKPLSVIYEASRRSHVIRLHRKRFKGKDIRQYYENEFHLWDGSAKWFGVTNSYFEIEEGERFLLSIFRDITDQKKSNEQIFVLAQALKNISECVSITDLEGSIIFVNSAFLKTYGYTEKEIIGLKIESLRPERIGRVFTRRIDRSALKGKWQGEIINKRKDGTEFPVFLSASGIKDENGNIIAYVGIATDITERKLTESQIKETLSLLNATLESTKDGILVVNRNGKITGMNNKFREMWNIPSQLSKTKDDSVLIDYVLDQLSDPKGFLDQVNQLYASPGKESQDILKFKDGRIFERSSLPQKLGRSIVGRVWSFRDVTEKKRSEEALIESEKRFRLLFQSSNLGMAILIEAFEECNGSLCELFGCGKEEIIGKTPWDFSPEFQPDGRTSIEAAKEKIDAVFAGKVQNFYWVHTKKDGRLIDTEVTLNPISIEGRAFAQATIQDITERMKYEKIQRAIYEISQAVHNTEDMETLYLKIHSVIKSLMPADNFYIALYDERKDILSFPYFVDQYDSPPTRKKLGRGLTEFVLRSGKDILITGKEDRRLTENGEVDLVGFPSAVWLGVPLRNEGKNVGVMVLQDYENENAYTESDKQILTFVSEQIALVIERKRNSEELRSYTKELQKNKALLEQRAEDLVNVNKQLAESEKKLMEINAGKDKLFSIIAHDLKSPFQPLLGMSEILSSEIEALSQEEVKAFSREINKALRKQYKLLENLLSWSSIQTGRMDYNPQNINLFPEADEVVEILRGNSLRKSISVENNIDKSVNVFCDTGIIKSVLQNLISNAIKFTKPGGTIILSSSVSDGYAEIEVKDNGVGMNKDTMEKIFRLDTHHTTPGTAQEKGTGLGLIICKEMIEKSGGTIRAESEPGEGSSFKFTLPLA